MPMKRTGFSWLVLVLSAGTLVADEGFPLKNGNFKWGAGFWLSPSREAWSDSGGIKLLGDNDPHRRPEDAVPMQMYGGLWMAQDVPLVPGTYELRVETQVDSVDEGEVRLVGGSDEFVATQGPTGLPTNEWKRFSVKFEATGTEPTEVRIEGVRGSFRIRSPRIDIVKLETAPVPVAGGSPIGKIVLPEQPEPAESYAAWELQYFLWRMTGSAPGIDGRDPVVDGRTIVIGRAASSEVTANLEGLKPEGYVIAVDDATLTLAGNSPRGTLYAAYDFLKTQGCRWLLPGPRGEVIPERKALTLADGVRTESPDWDIRGFLLHPTNYGQRGELINVLGNDYFDWAVRNRINAVWHGTAVTHYLGAHRGHSHIQRLNHAWFSYVGKDPPQEWAPLVNGKRTFMHPAGRPNMVCTSNPGYRDRVVEQILKYFKEHPTATVAACSADDEPAYWCEGERCRAQDGDAGTGPWEPHPDGNPKIPMTDRALHFVNEVAERVSKVYPDKQIEMYAYASTALPPARTKVHSNVLVKVCYFQLSPVRSLFEQHVSTGPMIDLVNRWQEMGAKTFGLYDYGSFNNIDCPVFWFFLINDHLRAFYERWGFRHYLGETDNTLGPSMAAFNVRAASLWDRNVDYKEVLRDICDHYYGPASKEMFQYYTIMEELQIQWELPAGRRPTFVGDAAEYTLADAVEGQKYIDVARAKAAGDETILGRIEIAEFGQALFTHYIATAKRRPAPEPVTVESVKIAKAAHERIMDLWGKHGNYVIDRTKNDLESYRPEPVLTQSLVELPVEWEFKTDPDKVGLEQKWYRRQSMPDGWAPIRTDNFWTHQEPYVNYRGVGWYRVKFTVPEASRDAMKTAMADGNLAMLFGAVDGIAEIFLDGEKIAEQKIPAGVMWDKPFAIDLPGTIDPNIEHELVIWVRKDAFAAGLWKPVVIGVVERR